MKGAVVIATCLFIYAVGFAQSQGMMNQFKEVMNCFGSKDINTIKNKAMQAFQSCKGDMKNIIPCVVDKLKISDAEKSCVFDKLKNINIGSLGGGGLGG